MKKFDIQNFLRTLKPREMRVHHINGTFTDVIARSRKSACRKAEKKTRVKAWGCEDSAANF